ncbi:MAG: hypothetical protein Q4B48_06920 [Syntrophomonadaceae bacterium]|nr:hypothetical protein [Syntrophomonadaceae bacterium]
MKKLLALAMALIMVFALAACGGDTEPAPSGDGAADPGVSEQQPSDTSDDSTPDPGIDTPSGPVIAEGWEIPEYPHGELVYTEYDDNGAVHSLYFNNTTIEECHEYCVALESAGYYEVMNKNIHDDSSGRWMLYQGMHPSSYTNYQVSYPSDTTGDTVDTPDGEVAYQLVITNRGK